METPGQSAEGAGDGAADSGEVGGPAHGGRGGGSFWDPGAGTQDSLHKALEVAGHGERMRRDRLHVYGSYENRERIRTNVL